MKKINYLSEKYGLLFILLIAAILRLYKLDFQSLWLDEIHTMNESNPSLSFSEVYTSIMVGEQMPPLYYYLLHFLFKIFGYTSITARLFSVFISLTNLLAIYLLGKELINKRVGIIASALLCFNYFDILYSQEARPYELLMLVTIFSFLRIVKFIKSPNTINAAFYGISLGLMLLTHFFGLFVLLSQIAILFGFFIKTDKKDKGKFFLNSLIAGVIAIICFIPTIDIFIKVTQIKEFWITPTTIETIKQIFKDFSGNSDFILFLGIIAMFYFMFFFIMQKSSSKNEYFFSGIILLLWVVLVLGVPIVRSYLVVPMIISRYFITILPALILMIAIAINACKTYKIGMSFLIIFLVASSYEIMFHSHYYTAIRKEQFRESTTFIKENYNNHEPIVSSLGWYLPYFFKEAPNNYNIVDKSLEVYVAELEKDSTKIGTFWYFDAFGRKYNPNQEQEKFINKHFFVENNFEGFQAWTKHFVVIRSDKSFDIPLNSKDFSIAKGDKIIFGVDKLVIESGYVSTYGWAVLENQDATSSRIETVLVSEKNMELFKLKNQQALRTDVTSALGGNYNLDNSGFDSKISIQKLPKGKFQLGIRIIDKNHKKEGYILTKRFIENQ